MTCEGGLGTSPFSAVVLAEGDLLGTFTGCGGLWGDRGLSEVFEGEGIRSNMVAP